MKVTKVKKPTDKGQTYKTIFGNTFTVKCFCGTNGIPYDTLSEAQSNNPSQRIFVENEETGGLTFLDDTEALD